MTRTTIEAMLELLGDNLSGDHLREVAKGYDDPASHQHTGGALAIFNGKLEPQLERAAEMVALAVAMRVAEFAVMKKGRPDVLPPSIRGASNYLLRNLIRQLEATSLSTGAAADDSMMREFAEHVRRYDQRDGQPIDLRLTAQTLGAGIAFQRQTVNIRNNAGIPLQVPYSTAQKFNEVIADITQHARGYAAELREIAKDSTPMMGGYAAQNLLSHCTVAFESVIGDRLESSGIFEAIANAPEMKPHAPASHRPGRALH